MQLDYIQELNNLHEEWLMNGQKGKEENLVLDGQREFENDQEYLN